MDLLQKIDHRLMEMKDPAGPSSHVQLLNQVIDQPLPFHRDIALQEGESKALRPQEEPDEREELRIDRPSRWQSFKGLGHGEGTLRPFSEQLPGRLEPEGLQDARCTTARRSGTREH